MIRAVYIIAGIVCVALGAVGAVLPVLPTTPFMIVALALFAKSSVRLERWLFEHPRLGPPLVAWRTNRVISLRVKLTAWGSMLASLAIMMLTTASWLVVAGAASVMAIGAIYIARCPSIPPPD